MKSLNTLMAVNTIAPDIKNLDIRSQLNGVYVSKNSIIASNGYSLVKVEYDYTDYLTNLDNILIPSQAIINLSKKVKQKDRDSTCSFSIIDARKAKYSISCSNEEEIFILDLNRPEYPDTEKLFNDIESSPTLDIDYLMNYEYGYTMQKAFNVILKLNPKFHALKWNIKPTARGIYYSLNNVHGIIMPVKR